VNLDIFSRGLKIIRFDCGSDVLDVSSSTLPKVNGTFSGPWLENYQIRLWV
jgi:hypothetical protein